MQILVNPGSASPNEVTTRRDSHIVNFPAYVRLVCAVILMRFQS